MNGLSERVSFLKDDVFSFLENDLLANEKKYDFIVLDPPAFVKSSGKIKEALKAYRELNEMSMKLIKTKGLLATSSCSYIFPERCLQICCIRLPGTLSAISGLSRCVLRVLTIRCCFPCLRQNISSAHFLLLTERDLNQSLSDTGDDKLESGSSGHSYPETLFKSGRWLSA
jgi:hypothetical protein